MGRHPMQNLQAVPSTAVHRGVCGRMVGNTRQAVTEGACGVDVSIFMEAV